MTEFLRYIPTESRPSRLSLLEHEATAELARASARRVSLESGEAARRQSVQSKIFEASQSEKVAREELAAIIARQDELRAARRAPAKAALDAAVPTLTVRAPVAESDTAPAPVEAVEPMPDPTIEPVEPWRLIPDINLDDPEDTSA